MLMEELLGLLAKYVIVFVFIVPFECEIAKIFLRHTTTNNLQLLGAFYRVNLLTSPLTQLIALYIYNNSEFQHLHYFAYILPFLAEFFLFKWQFNKLYKQGFLTDPVFKKTLIKIVVLANTLSFLLILVVFWL